MNNPCLYDFFGIIDRTDVILKNNDSTVEFKTFNEQDVVAKFRLTFKNKKRFTVIEQMSWASKCGKDFYQHMKPLIPLLNESLSFFKMKYGLLTHDRLSIIDTDGHPYSWSDMPVKIKETIAAFLQVQREEIIDFLRIITLEELSVKMPVDEKDEDTTPSTTIDIETQKPTSTKKIPEIKYVLGERLLDTEDLCTLLNYTPRAIQNLRNKELIPFTIIGNKFFYRVSDLKEISEKNYHPAKR
jgi:hypothetical protein